MKPTARRCAWLVVGLLVSTAACTGHLEVHSGPKNISGDELARAANSRLEKQNSTLVPGRVKCPKARAEKGASVRCLRTVDLSGGRRVKIDVAVTINEVKSDGRFHFNAVVAKKPREFGVVGGYIERDLSKQYAAQFGSPPRDVTCPDLRGAVGSSVHCTLLVHDGKRDVTVTVDRVDRDRFDAHYVYSSAPTG